MNNKFDSDREDALLDAVLGGDAWVETEAAGKRAALVEFRARQRRRKVGQWLAQAAAVLLLADGVIWWPRAATITPPAQVQTAEAAKPTRSDASGPEIVAVQKAPTVNLGVTATAVSPGEPKKAAAAEPDTGPQYISEEEMLAMFPKGSCTIAEVNGQKELIFFDQKVEREGAVYRGGMMN